MELIENVHIKKITDILKSIGERVQGNLICDIYPDNWIISRTVDKIRNLQSLCRNKTKIIEIGVNACHSLVIMLLENPHADYLLFDLNYHTYTEPIMQYIKEAFPDTKIDIIYGSSTETVSNYVLNNPNNLHTYDFIHIDGGHTEDIFSIDYENCKKLSSLNGTIIFDDYDYEEIKNFIQTKIDKNEIIECIDKSIIKTPQHFVYQHI